MAGQMTCVGVLRFSVLAKNFSKTGHKSLKAAARHLFAPERLDFRLRLFERLTLRSLAKQTDQDFNLVVVTSDQLPQPYIDRLHALLDPAPNLHLRVVEPDRHYPILMDSYDLVPAPENGHRILFRLDDDDALSLDYVARLKSACAALAGLQPDGAACAVAFNSGFHVDLRPGRSRSAVHSVERTPVSAGLALVAPWDHPHNPYRFNHRDIARHYSLYSDAGAPGFIRTIHADNMSRPTLTGRTGAMTESEIAYQLRRQFDLSPDDLKDL